jgi:hypothetical protein
LFKQEGKKILNIEALKMDEKQAFVWVLFGYQGTPAGGIFTLFNTSLTLEARPHLIPPSGFPLELGNVRVR